MSDFIKKGLESLKNLKKDKREYRIYLERIKSLPDDYQFVYEKITKYMWSLLGGGDGSDMIEIHSGLLELFETGVAENKNVMEITGPDVAAFADELLRNANTTVENSREKLNKSVSKKLAEDKKADKNIEDLF